MGVPREVGMRGTGWKPVPSRNTGWKPVAPNAGNEITGMSSPLGFRLVWRSGVWAGRSDGLCGQGPGFDDGVAVPYELEARRQQPVEDVFQRVGRCGKIGRVLIRHTKNPFLGEMWVW